MHEILGEWVKTVFCAGVKHGHLGSAEAVVRYVEMTLQMCKEQSMTATKGHVVGGFFNLYIYTYLYTHIHIYIYTHACICVGMYVCICVFSERRITSVWKGKS